MLTHLLVSSITDVRTTFSDVHMADTPQPRIVRCPKCPTILLEPLGTDVYQCSVCFELLQAKRTSSNSRKKVLQGPSNENNGPSTSRHDATSFISHETKGKDQLNNDEIEELKDRSIKQQEQLLGTCETMLVLDIRKEEESQLQGSSSMSVANISTLNSASDATMVTGEEGMVMKAQNSLNCASRDVAIGTKEGELADEVKDVSIVKHDPNFESEITRDTSCELSFKYIAASSKSNVQLAQRRIHRLSKLSSEVSAGEDKVTTTPDLPSGLPSQKSESSDDYESDSSFSESASPDGSDSEFAFLAPSSENMGLAKLSDTIVRPKRSEGPHQLEWQDADNDYGTSTFPESSGLTVSIVRDAGKAGLEQGDKEEKPKDGHYVKGDLLKILVSTGIDDATAFASKASLDQQENGLPGIEGQANKEGMMAHEGSLVSSPKEHKPKLSIELKDKTLEYLGVLSTINSVANIAVEDASTSILHINAVDIVEDNNRKEKLAARSIAATRGDSENAHSDLRKKHGSAEVGWPLVEKINLSHIGVCNTMQSEGHHQQDGSCEKVRVHNRVEVVKMLDAKEHPERKHASDEELLFDSKDVASSSRTHQDRRDIRNEEVYISRTLEGSSRTYQGHVQATHMLAGPFFQFQNPQTDLHLVGQTAQPFGSNIYIDGSKSVASTLCSYQAPSHPWMLPMAMPGHGCNHHGCHPIGPVCMPYVHGQHSHVPQLPMPSCLLCSRTMGHHQEVGNYYHQGYQPCMLCHSTTCFPPQIPHMHDTSVAATKPLRSLVRKPKHYPPLPQGRTAPYVVCRGCNDILEVPVSFPPCGGGAQKLRCGGCLKVSKFSFPSSFEKSHIESLEWSAVGSSRKASTSSPPSFEYLVRKREVSGANAGGQSTEISHGQSLLLCNQWGSISSRHYTGNGVARALSNRSLHHSSQSEMTGEIKPGQDELDTTIPSTINSQSSQDEFFFRVLSRKTEFDSSRRLFSGFKTTSSRFGNDSVVGDQGPMESDDVPLQCTVDEKEEGLDFGAPRPSDGESLDQRSPESRVRSPENLQTVKQLRPRRRSFGDEDATWATEIQEEFGSKPKNAAQERRLGISLLTLLNQESTKFEINLEEKVLKEEPTSSGAESLLHDPMSNSRKIRQPRNLRGQHFVRKGQRYIAAMLTRSLKHQVNH